MNSFSQAKTRFLLRVIVGEGSRLSNALQNATQDSPEDFGAELFIVEGESASLAVQRVCDSRFQAVLPMQGKPLNAWKANRKTVLKFQIYQSLIEILGVGFDESLDLANRKFDRVLILTDPDADGIHCGALLLLFFYRWLRPWIESERLLQIHAPKLQISAPGMGEARQLYTEEGARQLLDALEQRKIRNVVKQNYRGLASLNADILKRYCTCPATRKSRVLTVDDAAEAIRCFGGPSATH